MSENTAIEWADHTFNPWEGCQKVGPGCDHCYAEARNSRFNGGQAVNWGPGAPRRRTAAANWRKPTHWESDAEAFYFTFERRQRVFCASLADWLDNEVPAKWLADLLDLVRTTPHLDWLMLTKRIGNLRKRLEDAASTTGDNALFWWIRAWLDGNAPTNVWLGATVVNQEEADRDIPKLLAVPARVRFMSIEPMLGPVDVREFMWPVHARWPAKYRSPEEANAAGAEVTYQRQALVSKAWADRMLSWVICGGESGHHARPMHPDWARSLRDQCAAAGVPFLWKQWGEWLPINQQDDAFTSRLYRSNVRAKLHEDQAVLDDIYGRTCTVPYGVVHHDGSFHAPLEPMAFRVGTGAMSTFKVGKKAAGRLLDGVEHNGFPAP